MRLRRHDRRVQASRTHRFAVPETRCPVRFSRGRLRRSMSSLDDGASLRRSVGGASQTFVEGVLGGARGERDHGERRGKSRARRRGHERERSIGARRGAQGDTSRGDARVGGHKDVARKRSRRAKTRRSVRRIASKGADRSSGDVRCGHIVDASGD